MITTTKLHSYSELKELFEQHLFAKGFEDLPQPLYEPTLHIMKMKAKRIRPVLLLAACEAFGGTLSNALDAAAAIEVYHNFTLVHDDIIDEADLRRNEATVHKSFGIKKAILTGDVMSLHAMKVLNKVPRKKHYDLLNIFLEISSRVIEGEMLDVEFEKKEEISVQEYIHMIRLKTSVFLAGALQMGALLGDADASDQKSIYAFGENLGIAFQIKDDYLDVFGDQKTFGKRIGGDIVQNKKTFLICRLTEKADAAAKRKLNQIFQERDEEKKMWEMKKMLSEFNIQKDTYRMMRHYYTKAIDSLEALSLDPERVALISLFAKKIYERNY
ncbi:MAG: polyprenyl synthetase family protein [Bacteroidales bacterium]|nr:polyprenyl synthetase family protein [Bacteroidales bacterium]